MIPVMLVADFLDDLSTDLMGGFVGIYTDLLGNVAWLLGLIGLLLPLQNRLGTTPTVIIGIMVWGTFSMLLPQEALNMAKIIITLTGGIAIAVMFVARRRVYG